MLADCCGDSPLKNLLFFFFFGHFYRVSNPIYRIHGSICTKQSYKIRMLLILKCLVNFWFILDVCLCVTTHFIRFILLLQIYSKSHNLCGRFVYDFPSVERTKTEWIHSQRQYLNWIQVDRFNVILLNRERKEPKLPTNSLRFIKQNFKTEVIHLIYFVRVQLFAFIAIISWLIQLMMISLFFLIQQKCYGDKQTHTNLKSK